ncbi:MAG: hypothetical protein ACD_78C00057G0003 [uncultured bacterium (gcode 4)]|uniref:Uncharacterized protein n=1 Tax=uncultured bacterium (gcode 4) TaxID=1234023 RepID=K1XZR0_9BACT|nr:MAG: hypothetical protein ACD_78C00057G0003 [uncultured bacterium (gcode 4)]
MGNTTPVVKEGNMFSSLFNPLWQPGSRITTVLSALPAGLLVGIIWYGWHRPFELGMVVLTTIVALIVAVVIFSNKRIMIVAAVAAGFTAVFVAAGFTADVVIFGNTNNAPVDAILGVIIGIVAGVYAEKLWEKNKEYYLPLFLVLAIISSWLIFSNLPTTGDSHLEWFSRENGKLSGKFVFIPLFFNTAEGKYFVVKKITPREIPAKISVSSEKSGWKTEEKFDGNLRVEFQPQNYGVYRVILEHGNYNVIHVEATSKVAALKAVEDEIRYQLNLKPEGYKIIVDGIWN